MLLDLPVELLLHVTSFLNLRSLINLGKCCTFFHNLLDIKSVSDKVLKPIEFLFGEGESVYFWPGPLIKHKLPDGAPINGIYFKEGKSRWNGPPIHGITLSQGFEVITFENSTISYFFPGSDAFEHFIMNVNPNIETIIATIHTTGIHPNDLGIIDEEQSFDGHWNDLDCDFNELFAFGKNAIKSFWYKY